jgi:tRNA dimethylallyltransferase
MQVYRYMDIGTAKPTAAERARIAHHLIDIVDPDESFDAARYARLAHDKVMQLHHKGILPFVVGGTGLYIKALLHGLFRSKPPDPMIRLRLKQEAARYGSGILYDRLQRMDPESAKRLNPHDTYRIVRALETVESTGKSITKFHREHQFSEAPFQVLKIGLTMERETLYERINQRVDEMIAAGFLEEVKRLLAMGYTADLKSMQSIGYRHMAEYLEGTSIWEECLRTLKRDHRRYAKRQFTWFFADNEIIWKEPGQLGQIIKRVEKFLAKPQPE